MPGPAARVGDQTAHGGLVTGPGSPDVLIEGRPAATVGTPHVCPLCTPGTPPVPHLGGPVATPGAPNVFINGRPVATVGSLCTCAGGLPDVILSGASTVLIGTNPPTGSYAAGAAAASVMAAQMSAAVGAQGSREAVTREQHWLDVAFEDAAGRATSGLPYRLAEGAECEGMLRLDGRVVRDGLPEATAVGVMVEAAYGARWSHAEADVGEEVGLSACTEGFPDGTAATVQVLRRDVSGPDVVVATIDAEVHGGRVEARWAFVWDGARAAVGPPGHSAPVYGFTVLVGRARATSGYLRYRDWIEVATRDGRGQVRPETDYRLLLADGTVRLGRTGSDGTRREHDIPPGPYRLERVR